MSVVILISIMALLIGTARAITQARRGGYHGLLGFVRWVLMVISRESWATAEGIREFEAQRASQRQAWNENVRFGEVR